MNNAHGVDVIARERVGLYGFTLSVVKEVG